MFFFKKVLKTGEMLKMLKMLKVLQGIPPPPPFFGGGGGSIPQKTFNIFNISPVLSTFLKNISGNFNIFNISPVLSIFCFGGGGVNPPENF